MHPGNGLSDQDEARRLLADYHGDLDFVRERITRDSYVTREGDILDLLDQFEASRKARVSLVVEASMRLVDCELHPDTPGANPAALMESSLAELTREA